MTFVKGKSGNPSGRPKITIDGKTLTDLAREHTQVSLDALVRVVKDEDAPPAAVVSAANAILDRGWGKPQQSIDMTVTEEKRQTSELTDEELERHINARGGMGVTTQAEGPRSVN